MALKKNAIFSKLQIKQIAQPQEMKKKKPQIKIPKNLNQKLKKKKIKKNSKKIKLW
jgi:hypothetical protein